MLLRPISDADVASVLDLNAASVDALSPLDGARLADLRALTTTADVVDVEGEVAAFVLVFGASVAYDSVNYRWFGARYPDFAYLDRIVVGERWRRRGIGRLVYDAVEQTVGPRGRVVCEVYAEPPNHASLAFHRDRGYVEVGRVEQENGKVTAMLVKELAG